MFGVDWGSSQTILVNLTNAALGVAVMILLVIALADIIRDLSHRH